MFECIQIHKKPFNFNKQQINIYTLNDQVKLIIDFLDNLIFHRTKIPYILISYCCITAINRESRL